MLLIIIFSCYSAALFSSLTSVPEINTGNGAPAETTSEACKRLSQMRGDLAACREQTGSYNRLPKVLYVFEHKTQYLLIPALWHFDISVICPHRFRRV